MPLVVQWLRFCTSNAGDEGSIPGQGTKIPHALWPKRKKKKNQGGNQKSKILHYTVPSCVQTDARGGVYCPRNARSLSPLTGFGNLQEPPSSYILVTPPDLGTSLSSKKARVQVPGWPPPSYTTLGRYLTDCVSVQPSIK